MPVYPTMANTVKLKAEIDHLSLCHGCLSQDRSTAPISPGELSQIILYMLTPHIYTDIEAMTLCWECMALLRRFTKFRSQLLHAQKTLFKLWDMNTNISTLSNLKTISNVDFDQSYEFISELPNHNAANNNSQTYPELQIKVERIPDDTIKELTNNQNTEEKWDFEQENYFDDSTFDSDTDTSIEIDKKPTESQRRSNENKKQRKLYNKMKQKFLKHAIVTTLNTNFANEKNVSKYFTEEYLDENQVDEYQLKRFKRSCIRKCKDCNKQFYMKTNFLRHRNLNHRNKETDSPNDCLLCRKKFSSLEKLQVHWKHTHSRYSRCNMCHMYCKKRVQKQHLKFYHSKQYSCDKCGEQLLSAHMFNVHYKASHSTFICDVCDRTFQLKRTLIKHIRAAHSEIHKCEICQKKFGTHKYLLAHIGKHNNTRPRDEVDREAAYCVECDRQYSSINQFKQHLGVSPKHNSKPLPVKSIPCPECGKIFRRTTYMKNHLYVTHMREKAKHSCELCGKYFATNWGLKVHNNNVHLKLPKPKNEICDLCGRGFVSKHTLVNHRRTHTGERPYACQLCSAAFAQKVALQSHQKTHHKAHHKEAVDSLQAKVEKANK